MLAKKWAEGSENGPLISQSHLEAVSLRSVLPSGSSSASRGLWWSSLLADPCMASFCFTSALVSFATVLCIIAISNPGQTIFREGKEKTQSEGVS